MSKTKIVALIFLMLAGIVVCGVMLTYFAACGRVATTPARVINKLVDENNVISRYEWYHDAYRKCLAYDQQLRASQQAYAAHVDSMDRASWSDKQERARLNMVVLGLRNQRASLVEQYNANSSKLTQNRFKGWNLPHRLTVVEDTTTEVGE